MLYHFQTDFLKISDDTFTLTQPRLITKQSFVKGEIEINNVAVLFGGRGLVLR